MKNILLQKTLEKRATGVALKSAIKVMVEEMSFTRLIENINSHIKVIEDSDFKHKEVHISILKGITEDNLRVALRTIMFEQLTTKAYLDRNVLARKIGQRVCSTQAVGKVLNKVTVELSTGLTILYVFSISNIVHYNSILSEDKTISAIKLNHNLFGEDKHDLELMALDIRANRFMVMKPTNHSSTKVGGCLSAPSTMLGSGKRQSDSATSAVNKLQDVAYEVRRNFSTELMSKYSAENKWYNKDGIFQSKEWSKFLQDYKIARESEDGIFFPWGFDERGRIYDRSAYIKVQGDKFSKSILEFKTKQAVTIAGFKYLKIAIANELFTDKCSEEDAVEWFDKQELSNLESDSLDNPVAWTLIQDYKDAMLGKAIGTIVHWDATNSGLQIYSLIGKDKLTASLCNVYNIGTIADAYAALAAALNKATKSNAFNRSNVKKAFMTFLYGSMKNNILHGIEDIKNGVAKGIGVFFPATMSDDDKWELFCTAMEEIAPAAIQLMNLIFSYKEEGKTKYNWIMPDGFEVETTMLVTYMNRNDGKKNDRPAVRGWFMDRNGKTHEGSISVIVEEYDPLSRALAPNVIHSIDAYIAREVIRRANFEIHFIHDSFGVHPNNVDALRALVREVYAEVADSNILIDILSQLNPEKTGALIKRGLQGKLGGLRFGDLTKADVLQSNYIIR